VQRIRRLKSVLWIPHAVFDNPQLSRSDIMVYMALVYYMNQGTKETSPSIATIRQDARLGQSSVYRSLEHLETEGLIESHRGRGRVNHYVLLDPQ